MTTQEHLLVCLAEECMETAHRISKALRFGLTEVQAEQPYSNAERIAQELNDLIAVAELVEECGAVPANKTLADIDRKKAKVKRWLEYAQIHGTVKDESPTSGSPTV